MKTNLNLTLDVTPLLTWLIGLLGRLQKPAATSAPPVADVLKSEAQPLPETLARIAESQLAKCPRGACEIEGNNKGPQIREYQKATWLTPGPWAWCAAFVCWCLYQTLQLLGEPKGWSRPQTAGAYDFELWARGNIKPHPINKGWTVLTTSNTTPRRGDIVTFTWSHIGIFTGYDSAKKLVATVEGNAGAGQTSDSLKGDGVVAKQQKLTSIRRIIRYIG